MTDKGNRKVGSVLRGEVATISAAGASATYTGDATPVNDLKIYKNHGTTERASTSGMTLTKDFDGKTGVHTYVIDLSDNADAGFFAADAEYMVVLANVTVGGVVVNVPLCTFGIESTARLDQADVRRWNGTAVPAEHTAGYPIATIKDGTGTGEIDTASGVVQADVRKWNNTAVPAEHTAGYPIATIKDGTGTGEIDTASGVVQADVRKWNNTAVPAEHTAGYPIATIKVGTGTGEVSTASGRVAVTEAQIDQIVDEMWDELRSGHVVAGSFGEALAFTRSGTAQAGSTSTTLRLDSGASATDDLYNFQIAHLIGGTGAGQSRLINDYTGSTKDAAVTPAWAVTPDNTTVWIIRPAFSPAAAVWGEALPASYGSGTAGYIIGNSPTLQTVSDTVTAAVWAYSSRTLTAFSFSVNLSAGAVQAIWDALTSALTTAGSVGRKLADLGLGSDNRVLVSANAHTSGETVAAVTGAVGSVTGAVGSVTGNVGGNVTGSVGSVVGNVGGNVVGSVASVTAAVTITAASVQAIWDALTSALTTSGSIGRKLADWALGSDNRVLVSANAHTAGVTVAAVTGAVGSVTGAVGSVTGNVGGNVVGSVGSVAGNVSGNVVGSVASVTGAVGSVTGNVGGNVVGSVASVTGAVGSVTGSVGGNVTGSVGSVVAAVTITAASVQAIWDALTSALTTSGSIGRKLADWVLGSDNRVLVSANAHTAGVTVAAVTGAVGSVAGAVASVTGNVGGNVVGSVGSVAGNVSGNIAGSVASVTADVGITQAGADKVWGSASRTLTAFSTALAVSVWDVLEAAIGTANSIGTKVKALTFGVANAVNVNVTAVAGDTAAATMQARALAVMYAGTVTANPTITSFDDSALPGALVNQIRNRAIIFRTGALVMNPTAIVTSDPIAKRLTFSALPQAPQVGDAYLVI